MANRALSVNLVAWDNGGGLSTDIDVLTSVLRSLGCRVLVNSRSRRQPRGMAARIVNGLKRRLPDRCGPPYDINLFLESIDPKVIPHARLNVLIPNPEWFRSNSMPHLSRMDRVLCKTQSAVDVFRGLAQRTQYIGFTSPDNLSEDVPRLHEVMCLHVAGASSEKGTLTVLEVWRRHPDWPRLTVIGKPDIYDRYGGAPAMVPNVELLNQHLEYRELRKYRNTYAVHLCPSEAEGFGHCIMEAMSCGAVVVTTDAPPMNEVVTPNRGVLVRARCSHPMRLGTRYFVDVDDLERQIGRVIAMKPEERRALGQNARQWYLMQREAFTSAMKAFLAEPN